MSELLIVFAGVFTVLLMSGALLFNALVKQRKFNARLERVAERARTLSSEEGAQRRIRNASQKGSPLLEGLAAKLLPRPAELKTRLMQTGRRITLGRYLLVSFVTACVVATMTVVLVGLPWFAALSIAIIAGIGLPHFIVGWMIQRRRAKFGALFPGAIDLMVRGLRSGLPVTETIAAAGREMVDPVGPEFQRIADAVRLGQSLEDALWEAAKRLDTPEFKFFVISLSVQKETGGNLGETLANLSDILRSRKQMRLKIRAMSSEARASALILGSLPVALLGILYVLSPEYEGLLFTDMRGRVMLGFVGALMVVGGFIMNKMVKFEI